MNLYLISQSVNTEEYDVFDSAVVVAPSAAIAKTIYPGYHSFYNYNIEGSADKNYNENAPFGAWCLSKDVKVKFLGTTTQKKCKVICASYHAG